MNTFYSEIYYCKCTINYSSIVMHPEIFYIRWRLHVSTEMPCTDRGQPATLKSKTFIATLRWCFISSGGDFAFLCIKRLSCVRNECTVIPFCIAVVCYSQASHCPKLYSGEEEKGLKTSFSLRTVLIWLKILTAHSRNYLSNFLDFFIFHFSVSWLHTTLNKLK